MTEFNRKHYIIVGIIVAVVSFVLLLVGVKFILSNEILIKNLIAFFILSIIFGGLAGTLFFFKLKIAFPVLIIGIALGFIDMYRIFINGMGGWGDLVGLISLFTWVAIGLIAGLVVQIIYYLIKKMKDKNKV